MAATASSAILKAIDSQAAPDETVLKPKAVTQGVSGKLFIDRSNAPLASRSRGATYKGISIE